ncbi:MAG: hypothetical protein AAF420_15670, partial [Pseudomonadota bacterium]
MRQVCLLVLFAASTQSIAGVETTLYVKEYETCLLRIAHDAAIDSDIGTLTVRVLGVGDATPKECPMDPQQLESGIDHALGKLHDRQDLVAVSSVFVGRLVRYPWAVAELAKNSFALDRDALHALVVDSTISQPFIAGFARHDKKIVGAECEKILRNADGTPTDA